MVTLVYYTTQVDESEICKNKLHIKCTKYTSGFVQNDEKSDFFEIHFISLIISKNKIIFLCPKM